MVGRERARADEDSSQRTPFRLRVRVRLRRRRLDHELAAGFDPQTSGERALRACQPVCHKVLPWPEGVLGLAERLDGREPVNASGVARTLLLLTDGAGPIFNPAPSQSIGEAVWWIADGLRADEGYEA